MKSLTNLLIITLLSAISINAAIIKNEIKVKVKTKKDGWCKSPMIEVKIKNTTDEKLEILKWSTVMEDELKASAFKISTDKGEARFKGRMIKRVNPQEKDYIVFSPKETKSYKIDLSKYYRLEEACISGVKYKGIFLKK